MPKYSGHLLVELDIGGGEGGTDDGADAVYGSEQATDFVRIRRLTALQFPIGTVHGVYKMKPKLDIDRLKQIKSKSFQYLLYCMADPGLSDQDFRSVYYGRNL